MTPEQLERTIQFIIEHQAQTAIHLEKVSANVAQLSANVERTSSNVEQMSAGFRTEQGRTLNMQSLLVTMTELVQIQSHRIDRHDEDFQMIQAQYEDCVARLDQILDRLKDRN